MGRQKELLHSPEKEFLNDVFGAVADWSTLIIRDDGRQALKRQMKMNVFWPNSLVPYIKKNMKASPQHISLKFAKYYPEYYHNSVGSLTLLNKGDHQKCDFRDETFAPLSSEM